MSDDPEVPPPDPPIEPEPAPIPEPITTYRWGDKAQTHIIATCNGVDSPFPIGMRAWIGDVGPYQHTIEEGLKLARAYVVSHLDLQVRASMQSYVTKLMLTQNMAEMAVHLPKFAALDQWEGEVLDAGKANLNFPAPPDWLQTYVLDF